MREIVSVQIGQCGNQAGTAFWESVCQEHGIDQQGRFMGTSDLQLDRLDVLFNEGYSGRFIPRCVLVDLDPATHERLSNGALSGLFTPDDMVFGHGSASNNWAKGHNGEEATSIMGSVMDTIRRLAEATDCMQGFQISHSIGGGTGSGLGTRIAELIKEQYPESILSNVAIFPSAKMSDTVVEPYNATLSFHALQEFSDDTFVIDNEALYNIATGSLHIGTPAYEDINRIIAMGLTGMTASMRFPGQLNTDLRKLALSSQPFRTQSVSELTKQMFSPSSTMCGSDSPKHSGRYIAASALYRGAISTLDIDKSLQAIQHSNKSMFVEWMPNSVQTSVCDVPARGVRMSSVLIGNGSSVCSVFNRISKQFSSMLSKKAFLHWYTGEGMDEMQFEEAGHDMTDTVNEYRQYDHCSTGGDHAATEQGSVDDE